MSETCEHPFCTRSITQKCSSHCQLDLCEEHAVEHKNLFLAQYEKSFSNLTKSLQQLIASIEEKRTKVNHDYEQEITLVQESFREKFNEVDEKSKLITATQKLIKKKVQLLSDVKFDQALLHQHDVEQVKLYLNKIQEYPLEQAAAMNDEVSSLNVNSEYEYADVDKELDDDDANDKIDYTPVTPKGKYKHPLRYRGYCPLTRFGVYGLHKKHHVRLCSASKDSDDRHLYSHFHSYHRLTTSLSYRLTKAIMNGVNPQTTNILLSGEEVIDKRYDMIECPLVKVKVAACKRKFLRYSLKMHLLNVHHLTLETSNRIIDTLKAQGDLVGLDLDNDEFI